MVPSGKIGLGFPPADESNPFRLRMSFMPCHNLRCATVRRFGAVSGASHVFPISTSAQSCGQISLSAQKESGTCGPCRQQSGDRVMISETFAYFGSQGIPLPNCGHLSHLSQLLRYSPTIVIEAHEYRIGLRGKITAKCSLAEHFILTFAKWCQIRQLPCVLNFCGGVIVTNFDSSDPVKLLFTHLDADEATVWCASSVALAFFRSEERRVGEESGPR